MKEFIILGGNSQLAKAFKKKYPEISTLIPKTDCDITNNNSLRNLLEKSDAKYVLNCAAITDLKYCEKYQKKCFQVNSNAPRKISDFCKKYNKKLILISSNYAIKPRNIYGKSKRLMENFSSKHDLIIRTDFYSNKTFVVANLLKGKKTTCYKNIFVNPISINRLAMEIYRNKDRSGIVNIFSSKKINWNSFADIFSDMLHLDKKSVIPSLYKYKIGNLKRPMDSFVKSDIKIDIIDDLRQYANYIKK